MPPPLLLLFLGPLQAPVAPAPPAGHARMVEELARIAERSRSEHPYLGRAHLEELRARYANTAGQSPVETAALACTLGILELRSGELERAVARLREGREQLAGQLRTHHPRLWAKLTYHLGLALLRVGETQNCIAHHTPASCILPIGEEGRFRSTEATREGLALLCEFALGEPSGSPRRASARWLCNLAAMAIGTWPGSLAPELRIPAEVFRRAPFPRFPNAAPRLGVAVRDMAGGAVVEDFDGDGLLDLFTTTWDPEKAPHLFLRDPDGGFEEAGDDSGLEGITGGLNAIHGDVEGDGDTDLLVLRGAWLRGELGRQPNSLLLNDGGARFRDATFEAGLGNVHYPTQTGAFADFDNDGDLDLFIGNEATRVYRFPSQLFENRGDGSFRDVARSAGVVNLRYAKGAVWGDYDDDGWEDLYVSNLGGSNRLYENPGHSGTFVDVAPTLGLELPRDSFPVWFWDFDNDGDLDLYVASYYQGGAVDNRGSAEGLRLYPVVASYLGLPTRAETARLYRNDGDAGFTDVTADAGLTAIAMPMGANFGDVDGDGWLDFYLGTGYPYYDGLMPNVLYHNVRGRAFEDVSFASGLAHLQKGHGVAFADLDGDGDLDVFEQMGGAFRADAFPDALYENPGFGNAWLELRLEGRRSNRRGIGARVRVVVETGGGKRSIHRRVGTGGSFGANPASLHLGLGRATRVLSLQIRWPASATVQTFENVPLNSVLRVVEGRDEFERVPTSPLPLGSG